MNAFCNEAVVICCENVPYLRAKKIPCISQGMKKHNLLINLSKFSKIIRHYVFCFFFGIMRIMRSEPNYAVQYPRIIPDIYV